MDIRFQVGKNEVKGMDTASLRAAFHLNHLFEDNQLLLYYTHYDRMIVGGCKPINKKIQLNCPAELRAASFLERRELGIINVGGDGIVIVDDEEYIVKQFDCIYVGKGARQVLFSSVNTKNPALLYLLSSPAHYAYPTRQLSMNQATPVKLGNAITSNQRTVYKYIHLDGIKSCQLVMGLTLLDEGNVWNSFPPHTHTRRMEVYFYFNLKENQLVFHFLGEEKESRHVVIRNLEAVLSPPWSTHFGCGTSNYGFIWGMAGENLDYTDMDPLQLDQLI